MQYSGSSQADLASSTAEPEPPQAPLSADSTSTSGANTQTYRRRVLLVLLPFLTINLALGGVVMAEIPARFPLETRLPFLYALICFCSFISLLRRPDTLKPVGVIVALVVCTLFLTRIYTLVSGPVAADTSLPVFMPLYAYLPFAYFSLHLLLEGRIARKACLAFWAVTSTLVVVHLLADWDFHRERYGGTSLLLYLLVANPMFIAMLEIIARLEKLVSITQQLSVGFRRELELRRQIERHGERFKLAVMGSRDGLWEWPDMQARAMWWSKRTYELLKIDPLVTRPTTDVFLSMVHPEDAEQITGALARAATHEDQDVELEFRLLRGDREYQWFAVRAVTVLGSSDDALRMAGSISNIHQRKETEIALRRSNEKMEQFARVAAHDLRAPLNRMTMSASLAARKQPELLEKPHSAKLLDMVQRQCEYMNQLIESLLTYTRVEEGLAAERVDLDEVLDQVVEMLQPTIMAKNARIFRENLPAVVAIRVDMIRLLQNLIGNALKFCEEEPRIRVAGTLSDPFVELRISDNGIGIPEESLEEIFLPMARLHSASEYEGHGLGLAAVDDIVQRAKGRLKIESEPGQGTMFIITLLAAAPDEQAPRKQDPDPATQAQEV